MMRTELSSAALEDLEGIRNYISNVLDNPSAAERTIRKIRQSLSNISDAPFIGFPLKSKINVNTAHRVLVCGNYLIFYLAEKDKVSVSRIIYGKRDYANIFFTRFDETDK